MNIGEIVRTVVFEPIDAPAEEEVITPIEETQEEEVPQEAPVAV